MRTPTTNRETRGWGDGRTLPRLPPPYTAKTTKRERGMHGEDRFCRQSADLRYREYPVTTTLHNRPILSGFGTEWKRLPGDVAKQDGEACSVMFTASNGTSMKEASRRQGYQNWNHDKPRKYLAIHSRGARARKRGALVWMLGRCMQVKCHTPL